MSLIEGDLLRMAEEHANRRASADSISLTPERERELAPFVITFDAASAALRAFDFENGPIAAFIELVLYAASSLRASDIHFEPHEAGQVMIRLRQDGAMREIASIPASYYRMFLSRIKLSAGLKLNAERPQDGRFSFCLSDARIEARASSVPSHYGETLVLRLLDPRALSSDIGSLGFREDDFAIVMRELSMPNGMILNTGPTGSGKTTTLYSFLKKVARPERKAVTIEDPIEYAVSGIEQTQVDEDAGYGFANGLRAIVRQDPDIILVGEIRDGETATIAMQAALTGHQVFSTVHANDAPSAVQRLIDMGVAKETIGPAVNLIIAQRLVRRLCSSCSSSSTSSASSFPIDAFLKMLPARVARDGITTEGLRESVGCLACAGSGYRGRIALFELFPVNAEAEQRIVLESVPADIYAFATARGMVTMQQDGILKALHGITTLAEVEAATGPIRL